MKTVVLFFVAAVSLGFASFGVYYALNKPEQAPAAMYSAGELEWLRREFGLSPEQMARVEALHAEYRPICEFLCDRVAEAERRFNTKLVTAESYGSEVEEALAEFSRVKEACHRSMLQHVFQVAAIMEPDQRERYLTRVKAQVTMHDTGHP